MTILSKDEEHLKMLLYRRVVLKERIERLAAELRTAESRLEEIDENIEGLRRTIHGQG